MKIYLNIITLCVFSLLSSCASHDLSTTNGQIEKSLWGNRLKLGKCFNLKPAKSATLREDEGKGFLINALVQKDYTVQKAKIVNYSSGMEDTAQCYRDEVKKMKFKYLKGPFPQKIQINRIMVVRRTAS